METRIMIPFLLTYLGTHWFAAALLGMAFVAITFAFLFRSRFGVWRRPLLILLGGIALPALGDLALESSPNVAFWLLLTALVSLFCAILPLILSGFWSRWVGYPVGALLMFSL